MMLAATTLAASAPALALLLADVDDWVRLAVVIVPIILYALNSLLGGDKKAAPQRPQRPQQPAPPRQQIDDEVEQFLKRAAERRAGNAQRAEVKPPPSVFPQTSPSPQPAARGAREVISATVAEQRPSNLSTLGERPALASEFEERAARLSRLASEESQRLSQHLSDVFDHKVGGLESRQVGTLASGALNADAPPPQQPQVSDAAAVLEMLRQPQSARRAIILAEILARPEHRW